MNIDDHSNSRVSGWARRHTAPGAAVILDYETCSLDGAVCEVAVIAADTGALLLDTLINPREPITVEASKVHGITAADVQTAPTYPQILPVLEMVCAGRQLLVYNAEFDYGRTLYECDRWNLASELTNVERWDCVMIERSTWLRRRRPRYLRLGGNHRAYGDVRATRELLQVMAGRKSADDACRRTETAPQLR